MVDVAGVDARGLQGVALQSSNWELSAFEDDAGVADQHVS